MNCIKDCTLYRTQTILFVGMLLQSLLAYEFIVRGLVKSLYTDCYSSDLYYRQVMLSEGEPCFGRLDQSDTIASRKTEVK